MQCNFFVQLIGSKFIGGEIVVLALEEGFEGGELRGEEGGDFVVGHGYY